MVGPRSDSSDEGIRASTGAKKPYVTAPAADDDVDMSAVAPTTFAALGVCDELVDACKAMGFTTPTPIQAEAIPLALAGKDVIGLAQTGSGKTAAFAIPILQTLLVEGNGTKAASPFAVIIAPTRELVFQIQETFEALGTAIGAVTIAIAGGVDSMAQAVALAKRPHIIVATPGRLVDHLENTKGFSLRSAKFLVLDEADRILTLDFEKELDKIVAALPRDRSSYLFSATMTSKVRKLQRASLRDPAKVEVSDKYATVDTLVQHFLFVPDKHKDCYLAYLLTEFSGNSAIIFVDTQKHAQRLAFVLRALAFSAVCIHGGMGQPKRLAALTKFKSGDRTILVATDVASRGLDIPRVDLVINYDIPSNGKDYVHRVGRTARAGRAGRALNLVSQYDLHNYREVEELIGKKLDRFPHEESTVLLMLTRVSEAQRMAAAEMRDLAEKTRGGRGGRRGCRGGISLAGDDDHTRLSEYIGADPSMYLSSRGGDRGRGGGRGKRGGGGERLSKRGRRS
jgi:ATP-dependent RNA helicase DDX47/RRP3